MKTTIEGFDPVYNWNPTVELTDDGDLEIYFPEFPPPHLEECHDFDEVLASKINVDVEWQDRELFIVYDASPEVYARAVTALSSMKA